MTIKEALVMLWAWAHWYRIVSKNPKYLPGWKIFRRGLDGAIESLEGESRKTVLRLIRHNKCIFCGQEIGKGTGDHVIPLVKGGPQSVENFIPLCRECNASKGTRDLLEWWIIKGRHIKELNLDALVVYLRLTYRISADKEKPAPYYLVTAVEQAKETIPKSIRKELL